MSSCKSSTDFFSHNYKSRGYQICLQEWDALAANEALHVVNCPRWVCGGLVLCGIADQALTYTRRASPDQGQRLCTQQLLRVTRNCRYAPSVKAT